jgi:hypothetical protein
MAKDFLVDALDIGRHILVRIEEERIVWPGISTELGPERG